MSRKKRDSEGFNLSFIDVICCGFGAIVLLLLIAKTVDPEQVEQQEQTELQHIAELQKQLFDLRGESLSLERQLKAKREQLSLDQSATALLRGQVQQLQAQLAQAQGDKQASENIKAELALALQKLSAEMQRLQQQRKRLHASLVGGIPVDSEYIAFIIDTSGSMFKNSWPRMLEEISATLELYPSVKGIQIMNDMGEYMYSSYRGKWIPDTPARRQAIKQRLRSWNPFSNSSPVEGIQRAIRSFYDGEKQISLYVFGDEFSGRSINQVVQTVDRLNREHPDSPHRVRIHAVGFPVQFAAGSNSELTGIRFAALMRELSYRNGGSFVGLNSHQRQSTR